MRVFFLADWPVTISLINSCNEKLLKIGVKVGEIKMGAGMEVTHSKGYPEIIIKFLRALNTPVNIRLEKTTIAN